MLGSSGMSQKRRRSADAIAFIPFGENSRHHDTGLTGQDASNYWFTDQQV